MFTAANGDVGDNSANQQLHMCIRMGRGQRMTSK